ncbi:MAG: hypothetical protein WBP13_07605 [Methylophilaceae bacterium]
MEQNSNLEIRFNAQNAVSISNEELALIESVMLDLILAMIQQDETGND